MIRRNLLVGMGGDDGFCSRISLYIDETVKREWEKGI